MGDRGLERSNGVRCGKVRVRLLRGKGVVMGEGRWG